ncbi:MAG: hypothetical protein A2V87_01520 [Deltaproteobacteria bacterium RBG_16_58_17]|nr:MAG: hypothetical protein A2V87_01520 [Deltaproteobacteria bacterium RBG_16_58_17]OHE16542.1 MAG: hypothetical protein A2X96_06375 [Syntrophobacterales bacterium GWC2_56_13]
MLSFRLRITFVKFKDLTPKRERGVIMIRANFTMKLNDLDAGLIEKLKSLFKKDKLIEINVLDDRDETEYLLSTSANRESILRSLDQLKRNDIISKSPHDLEL